jgi:hypothetical protein
MRTINVTFENREYERLTKAKGEKTWREFILSLAGEELGAGGGVEEGKHD